MATDGVNGCLGSCVAWPKGWSGWELDSRVLDGVAGLSRVKRIHLQTDLLWWCNFPYPLTCWPSLAVVGRRWPSLAASWQAEFVFDRTGGQDVARAARCRQMGQIRRGCGTVRRTQPNFGAHWLAPAKVWHGWADYGQRSVHIGGLRPRFGTARPTSPGSVGYSMSSWAGYHGA